MNRRGFLSLVLATMLPAPNANAMPKEAAKMVFAEPFLKSPTFCTSVGWSAGSAVGPTSRCVVTNVFRFRDSLEDLRSAAQIEAAASFKS
jgi:hypothetical protein